MLFVLARVKSKLGSKEPSRCMWCSHLGSACRNGWRMVLHIDVRLLYEVQEGLSSVTREDPEVTRRQDIPRDCFQALCESV
jgi:hypothetical protein